MGISVDSLARQQEFTDKHQFTYPLLADAEKKIAKAYGVLSPSGYASRATFVIDKKGVVRKIYGKADAKKNAEEVLDWIKDNLKEK